MTVRLVNIDDVKDIICKYENRALQKTMVYEIEKLNSCSATEEQFLQILGDKPLKFEES